MLTVTIAVICYYDLIFHPQTLDHVDNIRGLLLFRCTVAFESALIGQFVFVGMLFGAITLANLADRFGRKRVILLGTLGTAIFGVLSGTESIVYGQCGRFCCSLSMTVDIARRQDCVPLTYLLYTH